MKNSIKLTFSTIVAILVFFCQLNLCAITFKAEDYTEVKVKALKLQVEEYRNKKITYTGVCTNILTTFPNYADKSGIKAGKYFWLVVSPNNVPVIARKGKNLDSLIIAIKRGSTVKVYGKVKKFKYKPKRTIFPPYYLELINIEVTKEPEKELPENNGKNNFRQRWKNKLKNRTIPPPEPPN